MISHLRAAGAGLILDARGTQVPRIVHWGADLGPLSDDELAALADGIAPAIGPSSVDVPAVLTLLPSIHDGWSGRPAVTLVPDPGPYSLAHLEQNDTTLTVTCAAGSIAVTTTLSMSAEGVLNAAHRVHNASENTVVLTQAALVLPLDVRATEDLDFTGRWALERRPQRRRAGIGGWVREGRHGRGGHDAAFLTMSGTPGFRFRDGEVRAMHVAWSGDVVSWTERSELGFATVGGGERLDAVTLAPGEEYASPEVIFVWSDAGIDGLSARLHPWVRSWSTITKPRPLTANTWEAVYFSQTLDGLMPLVDAASEVGVERFVLDDGWFQGRRDDKRALGDWSVDTTNWPDGLAPLARAVTDRGMEFGIWFEPEMVSLDSDLARAHPDWLLTAPPSLTWRWQHVLDLAAPGVTDHLFTVIDERLRELPISYVKWDHNRDLLVADAHAQTVALYGLIDRLRRAHPHVEFESCASGGARVDLGILRRTDRVWTSDTNDPVDRITIHRWTGVLVPPEYLGAHIGDEVAHTTQRRSDLSMRLAVALLGSAGIESDITRVSVEARGVLARFAAEYRRLRPLVHGGTVVNADTADAAVIVRGVVSPDRDHAIFTYAVTGALATALAEPLRPVGLDPDVTYEARVVDFGTPVAAMQDAAPAWFGAPQRATGRVWEAVGVAMPLLVPSAAVVLEFQKV